MDRKILPAPRPPTSTTQRKICEAVDRLSPKEESRVANALALGREQEGGECARPADGGFTQMESKLMALLDRIEIEQDHTLARQRFEIGEEAGYTVEFTGMKVGSDGKLN